MKVLNIGEVKYAKEDYGDRHEYTLFEGDRQSFLTSCPAVDAINRHLHDKQVGRFDAEVIAALPDSVKVIGNIGAGYDQIDVAACAERGIVVCNTPDAVREPTADTALYLLLAVLRNFGEGVRAVQDGKWLDTVRVGRSPSALKMGILGLGSIGKAIASRLQALGCAVQYHNRRQSDSDIPYVSFDELLTTSDVLFVSIPLSDATRGMLGAAAFGKIKRGSYVINTARGPIIDEAALVDALDSGRLRAVGLDVYEKEPDVHHGLRNRPECVLLPHQGTWTTDAMRQMERDSLNNIEAFFKGDHTNVIPEHLHLVGGK